MKALSLRLLLLFIAPCSGSFLCRKRTRAYPNLQAAEDEAKSKATEHNKHKIKNVVQQRALGLVEYPVQLTHIKCQHTHYRHNYSQAHHQTAPPRRIAEHTIKTLPKLAQHEQMLQPDINRILNQQIL